MLYFVYILQNAINQKYYIGSTNNLIRRLEEHNRGQTKSTRYAKNKWNLAFTETYNSSTDAKRREKEIKSYKGGNAFKKLISRD
ncbi:MAG: GIY-YIG nuclease family protein [Candidatus Gottesmanbacteria bacterium]